MALAKVTSKRSLLELSAPTGLCDLDEQQHVLKDITNSDK